MIKVTYREFPAEKVLSLQAQGHAGYAPKGQDIVCAGVSALMLALAYSVDDSETGGAIRANMGGEENVLTVQAVANTENAAKFELVTDGLYLLAQQYPENVQFINLCEDDADHIDLQMFAAAATTAACGRDREELLGPRPAGHEHRSRCEMDAGSRNPLGCLNLQLFAEGAAASDAAGAGAAAGEAAPAGIQAPALRPAQERLARRSRPGGAVKAAADKAQGGEAFQLPANGSAGTEESKGVQQEKAADSGQSAEDAAAEGETEENKDGKEEKNELTRTEKRRAFGQLMQGEYAEEFEEAMQRAAAAAVQNLQNSPQVKGLLDALGEAYGVDTGDLAALTDAVKNGKVKNDEYYETLAQQRGISVKTAKELDRMEGELQRANADKQRAEQMRLAAEHQQRAAAVRAQWEAEAAKLKASYPDFELNEVLNNPQVADMVRRGVGLEAAYRAAYFDRLMESQVARTAKQVENGVTARIQQRGQRPAENGTHPGGAAEMKVDVAHMTKRQREELARRARRGERIVL